MQAERCCRGLQELIGPVVVRPIVQLGFCEEMRHILVDILQFRKLLILLFVWSHLQELERVSNARVLFVDFSHILLPFVDSGAAIHEHTHFLSVKSALVPLFLEVTICNFAVEAACLFLVNFRPHTEGLINSKIRF